MDLASARPLTLTHHILFTQQAHPEASGDLSILLHSIEMACKYISGQVSHAGLLNLYGLQGDVNVQGEEVKKLDIVSNDAFIECLRRSTKVSLMASEENEDLIYVAGSKGRYMVVFDPLDGSSNIDANVSIGTIFGVYHRSAEGEPSEEELLQPGTSLVAAGYCMYGSATLMVLSTGDGVNGFTLDRTSGEFVLSHPDIRIPAKGKIYSVNEGNAKYWPKGVTDYVHSLKFPETGSPKSLRYIGSMVADVHRTLNYGGIFMYPADSRAKSGKLRLLYEANPMAFLCEQAGGKASIGGSRILEVVPRSVHQRVPVFLGSSEDVEALEAHFIS